MTTRRSLRCRSARLALALLAAAASAAERPVPDVAGFRAHVQPILQDLCVSCHGGGAGKPKAGLDLTRVDPDLVAGGDAEHWQNTLDALNAGEMPPAKAKQPSAAERAALVGWITAELAKHAAAKPSTAAMRRLNVNEYRNTLLELTGIPFDPTGGFSQDPRTHGFDTVGSGLVSSPLHVEHWVSAARESLARALVDEGTTAPQRRHWRVTVPDWRRTYAKGTKPERVQGPPADKLPGNQRWRPTYGELGAGGPFSGVEPVCTVEDLAVSPSRTYDASQTLFVYASNPEHRRPGRMMRLAFAHWGHEAGIYRVRVRVSCRRVVPGAPPPTLIATLRPEMRELLATSVAVEAQEFEFSVWRDSWRRSFAELKQKSWGIDFDFLDTPVLTGPDGKRRDKDSHGVVFERIEIEGPVAPTWPPPHHVAILPANTDDAARTAIASFAARAWRRPVAADELSGAQRIFADARGTGAGVVPALRTALCSVLASPHCVHLVEGDAASGRLTDHQLASRLSYLLWSGPPDAVLRGLADRGALNDPAVLEAQTRRMLADPRSRRFVSDFAGQWLRLRDVWEQSADETLYPGFDRGLQAAMVGETEAFIAELLAKDLDVRAVLDADFAMLNERIAHHYGIPGVVGNGFRRVQLEPGWQRGGVLAQASVLTVTANGIRTLPVHRGVFVLEALLDDPPPAPPPNAGQIEEVVGLKPNATVREKLDLHRSKPACMGCHQRIDPYGFALERYGAIGELREREQVVQESMKPGKDGTPVTVRRVVAGDRVETAATLADGRSFADLAELKAHLAKDGDRFLDGLLRKLLTYALGRPAGAADRPLIASLRQRMRSQGCTLSSAITGIVLSEAFRSHRVSGAKP